MKTETTTATVKSTRRRNLRMITVTGILSAMGAVLMALEFPVPFMPSFVKFDFRSCPHFWRPSAWGLFRGCWFVL